MREYYTEAFYARVLNSNTNYKANAQRIHPPHKPRLTIYRNGQSGIYKPLQSTLNKVLLHVNNTIRALFILRH